MIQRTRCDEANIIGRTTVDVNPIPFLILDLIELEFINELPVSAQSKISVLAQQPGSFIREVRLGVYESQV
jgi:hypothetical protein